MGVSGTGKSTVADAIAARLAGTLVEGDSFHPQANIDKMAAGMPLDDDDRRPWLQSLARKITRMDAEGKTGVIACSSLRRLYRDWLRLGVQELFFVHLHTDYDVLDERMSQRRGHFMPPSLLKSQFETLEMLEEDELGLQIDVRHTPQAVVTRALEALAVAGLPPRGDEERDPGLIWRP
ncbi:gluconokinase [Ornithinimicrobium pratense]|uniref:Gluconokinase n=2 Tax=Ornithinimicrobium pratense TaxID=2593973 RepID=A0A5J6V9B4_9MICO|nr:gluconokinase [Ornithinimicrobium pratense]